MKLVMTVELVLHVILIGCWMYVVFTYDLPFGVFTLSTIAWLGITICFVYRDMM
jgi:hypothetical protein